ncbi:hypothetical protein B484DRAFT_400152 [Ochromonadaceae sp. CCMP2298]|nr:hypothetical protein B484DRAFT_400152 [Ochromonadaceae sp. CCMP2298]
MQSLCGGRSWRALVRSSRGGNRGRFLARVSAPPEEAVDSLLIPVGPNDAALRLVDGAIRRIPALVADMRVAGQLTIVRAVLAASSPILVVHDRWFRSGHLVYRQGMAGVDTVASVLAPSQFELSAMRTSIAESVGLFSVALLRAPPDQNQRLADALSFRHALAGEFAVCLRKNAGKGRHITFEMRASPLEAAVLFGWPGVPPATVKTRAAGSNRISFLVTAETILKPAIPKELLIFKLDDPLPLAPLLGSAYSYYPVVDMNYRSGGFSGQNYAAIMAEVDCIVASYDLSTYTLFVRSKVS